MSLVFRQRLLRFTTGLTGFEQVLLLVLMVLNKFIEISTLIKRNLNFKCEVKSQKVRLSLFYSGAIYICQSCDCIVMTSVVHGERWSLDSSPGGVPAADIW